MVPFWNILLVVIAGLAMFFAFTQSYPDKPLPRRPRVQHAAPKWPPQLSPFHLSGRVHRSRSRCRTA
jgi:hypothetical protein